MKQTILFFSLGLIFLFSNAALADNYVSGALAGSCTVQADQNFNISHNGAIDSAGHPLANVPPGVGGATWPVINCPNSGTGSSLSCASGWKPVTQAMSQMVCGASCYTYWITWQCAKLQSSTKVLFSNKFSLSIC